MNSLMTQTAEAWLNDLTNHYIPSSTQFDAAKSHRSSIEITLDVYLGLHEMFEIGSLRHGTGVWIHSDADYMASLKGVPPESTWTMLNKVKETLQCRFPATSIVVRRPAVVCRFSDTTVEVVPAYPSDTGYLIANPADGWMKSYPKDHNMYVNGVNNKHSGAVKRLARQLKVWKYRRNVPVSSCYLEMRTAQHMDSESAYLPLWDLYLSLKNMLDVRLAPMNDPTGLGSRFGACSSEANRTDALSKLSIAVARALKAKDYAENGYNALAIEHLRLLFDR
jgi:hypothetical protein